MVKVRDILKITEKEMPGAHIDCDILGGRYTISDNEIVVSIETASDLRKYSFPLLVPVEYMRKCRQTVSEEADARKIEISGHPIDEGYMQIPHFPLSVVNRIRGEHGLDTDLISLYYFLDNTISPVTTKMLTSDEFDENEFAKTIGDIKYVDKKIKVIGKYLDGSIDWLCREMEYNPEKEMEILSKINAIENSLPHT